MDFFQEMPRKGFKPTTDTYNPILKGLFRVGRCDIAQELLVKCRLGAKFQIFILTLSCWMACAKTGELLTHFHYFT